MSDIVSFSPVRALDGNGEPVPGAQARFYATGTTTPVTVFSDRAETTPHPVPLVADAEGVFPAVFRSGRTLKVVVTDADGVALWTVDPVLTVSAGGGAAASVSFEPTAQIPATNVQAAIESVQANLVAPLLEGGIGVTANAPVLANVDATNTASGFYRFTESAAGTLPAGWDGETGVIYMLRETATKAVQVAVRDGAWWWRALDGTWGAWRVLSRYIGNPEDGEGEVPALWAGADIAAGADARVALRAIGVGQTWQDVSGSRDHSTSYQNTTGRPIEVAIRGRSSTDSSRTVQTSSDGSTWIILFTIPSSGSNAVTGATFTVPDGWYYRVSGEMQNNSWAELR